MRRVCEYTDICRFESQQSASLKYETSWCNSYYMCFELRYQYLESAFKFSLLTHVPMGCPKLLPFHI